MARAGQNGFLLDDPSLEKMLLEWRRRGSRHHETRFAFGLGPLLLWRDRDAKCKFYEV